MKQISVWRHVNSMWIRCFDHFDLFQTMASGVGKDLICEMCRHSKVLDRHYLHSVNIWNAGNWSQQNPWPYLQITLGKWTFLELLNLRCDHLCLSYSVLKPFLVMLALRGKNTKCMGNYLMPYNTYGEAVFSKERLAFMLAIVY